MARPGPDPDIVAAVIKTYTTTSVTLEEIAAAAEVSQRTVLRWLAAENIPTRTSHTKRQDKK